MASIRVVIEVYGWLIIASNVSRSSQCNGISNDEIKGSTAESPIENGSGKYLDPNTFQSSSTIDSRSADGSMARVDRFPTYRYRLASPPENPMGSSLRNWDVAGS